VTAAAESWSRLARTAQQVPTKSVVALWRALNYLCAAQLYLADNVRLDEPLAVAHVKATPHGHWGVCPPVNLALAVIAPLRRAAPDLVTVIHGAGHAGPSALAMSYLDGTLGYRWSQFRQSPGGLHRLVTQFPHVEDLGGEITPMIPGHQYMGGQLGPALAFATGYVLDSPQRLAVVLLGDGECETGATAAAWIGMRTFAGSGSHGRLLPMVLVNGLRMGSPSVLSGLTRTELEGYLSGLGLDPHIPEVADVASVRAAVDQALLHLVPIGAPGRTPVVVLTLPKGATGPVEVAGRRILGTPAVHKTPLRAPANDPAEFAALRDWLLSYRPDELIGSDGVPTGLVQAVLPDVSISQAPGSAPRRHIGRNDQTRPQPEVRRSFGEAVADVAARHATRRFRLFSPDELTSNRIPLNLCLPWVREILNEELCHLWLQGYLESGGTGLFITYEAFAPINTSLLHQYLKHRATARHAGVPGVASMNYLLTSLSWTNTYTHQNPSLISSLLDIEDPAVRVYTPADPARVEAVLDLMLASVDRLNVMVADKYTHDRYPTDATAQEIRTGMATWPHLSDAGPPDLVLAAAGDVATRQAVAALAAIRSTRPRARVRFVQVAELTSLGDPRTRPHALSDEAFVSAFGDNMPVLLLVPGYPSAVRGLLWPRLDAARRFTVLGYCDPGRPMSPTALLHHCGVDTHSLVRTAARLIEAGSGSVPGGLI
jgi:xylulose-5-phosphate/fructose-6-phosphate phosphoketolase